MEINQAINAALQALEVAQDGASPYHEKLYAEAIVFFRENQLVTEKTASCVRCEACNCGHLDIGKMV